MPQRNLLWLLSMAAILIVACVAGSSTALANDAARVELGIKPVGISGSYFDVTIAAGEAQQLTVELGNYGSSSAVARIYPADVYSLVNGGLGVRLADEPTGMVAGWLGIQAETIELQAGQAVLRSFAVRVPDDTEAGEYITSVVIEDATPVASAHEGEMVTRRVNRQAIAVAVTVPGPVTPQLSLGAIEHHIAGGRSVVTVQVHNDGNGHLQPLGELMVRSGDERVTFPIRMDSVYAGTTTVAEFAFTTVLEPGEYTFRLTMADERRAVRAATPDVAIVIDEATGATVSTTSVSAATTSSTKPSGTNTEPSQLRWMLLVPAIAVPGFAIICTRKVLAGLGRRDGAASVASVEPPSRPVSIRQLAVPVRQAPSPDNTVANAGRARFQQLDRNRPLT